MSLCDSVQNHIIQHAVYYEAARQESLAGRLADNEVYRLLILSYHILSHIMIQYK